ncbi:hypothetical protein Tco_1079583 [Tanacetum coccineum]|uniref:Integrase, catalytic region, zinc finger, CCHC-type, peptidase aspartic, catalytic n=1 Tax=Tanacetum coccineum TaxID=301880 RepID=A0ABQ5HS80_9ASTR
MNTIGMSMKPLQVNTKFMNHLQPEWRKFVTDVKLEKDMHSTNFDQLYAYLRQHEAHANEVRLMMQRFPDPLALSYQAPAIPQQSQASFPLLDSGLVVPLFLPSYDPIASLNKAMLSLAQMFKGDKHRGLQAVVEGVMLQVQGLTEMWEPIQQVGKRSRGSIFQNDDRDSFDSNCNEAPSASVVLMAKLSAYDSDVLLGVPNLETYQTNNVIDQSMQEMQYSEQPPFINDSDIDITSDSNVITYD